MQHLTRKFLLICLMLWLPLQGYAATTMPFCQQGTHDQKTHHQMSAMAQDGQATNAGHDQHNGKANTACDGCTLCHMCSAMALPLFAAQAHIKPDNLYTIPAQAAFNPHFPEQLQRPPLAHPV